MTTSAAAATIVADVPESPAGAGEPFDVATPAPMPAARAPRTEQADPHALVDQLLRSPGRVVQALAAEPSLGRRTRVHVAVVALCTALFGVALGSYRGGLQMLF